MEFKYAIEIKATPQSIFEIYADVENWSTWDKEVEYSSIQGTFQTGATGELKPKDAPKSKIFFTEVVKDTSFTTMGKLPLCKMYLSHTIDQIDNGSVSVTHIVSFEGLLSVLFGNIIGRGIAKSLPDALKGLKDKAEAKWS